MGTDGIWQPWNHQLSSKRKGQDETQLFNPERLDSTRCKCLLPGRPGPAMVKRDHSKHTFEGIRELCTPRGKLMVSGTLRGKQERQTQPLHHVVDLQF